MDIELRYEAELQEGTKLSLSNLEMIQAETYLLLETRAEPVTEHVFGPLTHCDLNLYAED